MKQKKEGKKENKNEILEKIKKFFDKNSIINKSPKEIKKIKKEAMTRNIHLSEDRKKFCKHCLSPYSGKEKIRLNKGVKVITCSKCNKENRWKLK